MVSTLLGLGFDFRGKAKQSFFLLLPQGKSLTKEASRDPGKHDTLKLIIRLRLLLLFLESLPSKVCVVVFGLCLFLFPYFFPLPVTVGCIDRPNIAGQRRRGWETAAWGSQAKQPK